MVRQRYYIERSSCPKFLSVQLRRNVEHAHFDKIAPQYTFDNDNVLLLAEHTEILAQT